MNKASASALTVQPLQDGDLTHVRKLFYQYPYKNYQLNQLAISKKKMVGFLSEGIYDEQALSFCLWEDGHMVGLASLRSLPWLSEHFEARMCSIQHFLGLGKKQDHYQTLLQHVLGCVKENDLWACRVASADILAIHALENSGFRFVGSEVYLVKPLEDVRLPDDYLHSGCEPCPESRLPEVLDIIDNNHFHNRYMYDPMIPSDKANSIYKRFLSASAFEKDNRLLIKCHGDEIEGFILYKFNSALSEMMGRKYASLDFIGVKEERKNAGVGVALNKGAVLDLVRAGVSYLVVRTLASNYPAIRICQKIGFKLTSTDLHFHYWVQTQGS